MLKHFLHRYEGFPIQIQGHVFLQIHAHTHLYDTSVTHVREDDFGKLSDATKAEITANAAKIVYNPYYGR